IALARQAGDVVSRDDLVGACWGERVVSEDALQRAVAKTRKLGDDTGAFAIKTVRGIGYRLLSSGVTEEVPSSEPLLAVLAFENFSTDPDMAFFADAIADEILQTVARGTKIAVISRASSFQFRGKDKAISNVAAELAATHVLDGTVRRHGARVRIGVELIDVKSARPIWQGNYERNAPDFLALQEEIAASVASALGRTFSSVPSRTIDAETYERFLRVREMSLGTAEFGEDAIEAADGITRAAPDFAPGWVIASIARATNRIFSSPRDRPDRLLAEALAAAEHAHALDPEGADTLLALGHLEPACGCWAAREDYFRRAIAAEGGADAMTALATHLTCVGRLREGLGVAQSAHALNPLHPMASFAYGEALANVRQFDAMIRMHQATLRRWPGQTPALNRILSTAAGQERWDVVDELNSPEMFARNRMDSRVLADLTFYLSLQRDPTAEARARLMASLQNEIRSHGRVNFRTLSFAALHCDLDEVFELVAQSSFTDLFTPEGIVDRGPTFQPLFNASGTTLRSDRRFVHLCARLGLVTYWLERGVWPDCADESPYDFRMLAREFYGCQCA
ncbi:MAG TPA: winged helix-turn-helix domain-containing protein, partial [Caulobacterales bacterium]|nr:winged helix-turn-helix domain-containing protein [Caulobacterales bacterium]